MVIQMNKSGFIKELSNRTNYSIEECTKINEIIERNFIISKQSKDKIISSLISELNYSEEQADNIYNISVEIITKAIKEKIKHPFRSQD